jgi:E3 ubiquitin-protein ligase DOA10
MKFPWFKRNGILFVPVTLMGWIILIASFTYVVYNFIDIDRMSHSVSDTLMNFVFRLIIIAVIYTLVGFLTSFTPRN